MLNIFFCANLLRGFIGRHKEGFSKNQNFSVFLLLRDNLIYNIMNSVFNIFRVGKNNNCGAKRQKEKNMFFY